MTEAIDSINAVLLLAVRYLSILVISYFLASVVFPSMIKLFNDAGLTKVNYQGKKIPFSGGVLFTVMVPVITIIGMLLRVKTFTAENCFLFMFVLIATGFMGFFDDQLGVHEVKGFRGHFRMLFAEKKFTSGAFKALFGGIIALVFSFGSLEFIKDGWPFWVSLIVNFLLVALATNSVNLFDLRPGRAGKAYLSGFIIILAFSGSNFLNFTSLFLPILAIMIYYLPFDLQEKVMMGDSGSNLLGASLGIMMAWMLSPVGKIVALVILVSLQLLAEKVSFSKVIEEYRVLRYIDEMGRRSEH